MIHCKHCDYEGEYETKVCPECGEPFSFTEGEVRALLCEAEDAAHRKEYESAEEIYRMLADFGVAEAQREHGRTLERAGEYDRATAYYRLAAAAGDAYSAYRYAVRNPELGESARRFWLCYASLLGCKESYRSCAEAMSAARNERLADYYYRLAAECDDTDSIVTLAKRYADGIGCEKNEGYAKWFMDKLTLPPIHAIRLAYRLRQVAAEEPPVPVCDFYDDFLRSLAKDAERFGFFGAERYLYELLSERADNNARLALSKMYFEGRGCTANPDAGLVYLKQAAVGGSALAYLALGDLSLEGHYVPKSVKDAISYYVKACDLGAPEGYEKLGQLYEEGELVELNPAYAITLYDEGANLGSTACIERSAALKDQRENAYERALSMQKSDPEGAFRLYAISTGMGYTPAEVKLGDCYLFGRGTKQDRRRAYLWYKSAARHGESAALYPLGLCYSHGVGTAFHYRLAMKTLKDAAFAGCENADKEIRRLYRQRLRKTVRQLFSKATRLLYRKKYNEAYRLYYTLSEMGDGQGAYYLGACYEFGVGTEPDRNLAYEQYAKAIEYGFRDTRAYHKAMFLKLIR